MLRVKVPKEIRISSLIFQVLLVAKMERDFKLLGQCLSDDGVMKIGKESNQQMRAVILFHEEIHGINDVYNLGLSEETIDRLAHGLADIWRHSFGIEFDWSLVEDK